MPKMTHCIACGSGVLHPLYLPENQPLAALSLPRSQQEAIAARRYPMEFFACGRCGHVFNVAFDYSQVPYQQDSNLMYNKGSGWQDYIEAMIDELHAKHDFSNFTVVEIGCGDGHFLKRLQKKINGLRCIGFEPGIDTQKMKDIGFEVINDYFVAERDLQRFSPDLIVCRHVIEHLEQPRDLVEQVSYWANRLGKLPFFLAEVPRINNSITQARINDYLYEHVSNFTDESFRTLFEQAGFEVLFFDKAYNDEVLVTLVRPKNLPQINAHFTESKTCHDALAAQRKTVHDTLLSWAKSGKAIAFWGGTGKGASFLNGFNISHDYFPLVVDSDAFKVGRFVPGMAQEIKAPEVLNQSAPDIIVITTQWRAKDIAHEIRQRGIACKELYVVRGGKLEAFKA